MADIAQITIAGRLSQEPEQVPGHGIVRFCIAVNHYRKGEQIPTSFFDCIAFSAIGKRVLTLHTGDLVTIIGDAEYRQVETKKGMQKRLNVAATQITFPPSGGGTSKGIDAYANEK